MKKVYAILMALMLTIAASGQTLNVKVGSVTYQFPAKEAGDMTFTDGTTLTIMGKTFTISDISSMNVDDTTVKDSTVYVTYGDAPTVTVAGNVARFVEVAIDGTQVAVTQNNSDEDNDGEITYNLTGTASGSYANGMFYLAGNYKATVELNGVTLTNSSGPAVCIYDGKRIDISSKKGTVNTLTGLGTKTFKGCLYIKGHSEFKGQGTLNVNCSDYHGIKSNEYMTVKKCTLNVNMTGTSSNLKDGIHISEYFQMVSGVVTVTGTSYSDDAIQVELDGEAQTVTADHDGEDSGNVYIEGGTLTVTAAGTATKGIKADGDVFVTGGTVTAYANGEIDVTDASDPSYTTGIKAGSSGAGSSSIAITGNYTQTGGSVTTIVNGTAGRGISVNGTLAISDGTVSVTNKGANKEASTYHCTAKGLKGGTVNISGGTIDITMSGAASKGIKADEDDGAGNMTISGGTLTITNSGGGAYDQTESDAKGAGCLKADKDMTISGGTLTLKATGAGGKCIKADQYLTVTDGNISATTTGAKYSSGSVTASPKAIRVGTRTESTSAAAYAPGGGGPGGGGPGGGGNNNKSYTYSGGLVVKGGTIVASSSNHEAIESKSTIDISGGYVYAYSSDDAINSASTFTISGGYVMGNSSGNDGLDANGNFIISGGNVVAVATRQPEVGIDANTEGGYKLTITGGNIVAIGGLENGSTLSGVTSKSVSYTKGSWYTFKNGSTTAFAFKVPSNSSMGTSMTIVAKSTPSVTSSSSAPSGTSIWNGYGVVTQ